MTSRNSRPTTRTLTMSQKPVAPLIIRCVITALSTEKKTAMKVMSAKTITGP